MGGRGHAGGREHRQDHRRRPAGGDLAVVMLPEMPEAEGTERNRQEDAGEGNRPGKAERAPVEFGGVCRRGGEDGGKDERQRGPRHVDLRGGKTTRTGLSAHLLWINAAGLKPHFAAVTMISTVYCGEASFASTVARAGALPGATQPSQTAFISLKVAMSESQIFADSSFDLSVPAWARSPSMIDRMSFVCSVTLRPAAFRATWPARETVVACTTGALMRAPGSMRWIVMGAPGSSCDAARRCDASKCRRKAPTLSACRSVCLGCGGRQGGVLPMPSAARARQHLRGRTSASGGRPPPRRRTA